MSELQALPQTHEESTGDTPDRELCLLEFTKGSGLRWRTVIPARMAGAWAGWRTGEAPKSAEATIAGSFLCYYV